MGYEEWVVGHARLSSKPHKRAKLDDKLSFFHQLSTLVSSGTPLLQALRICAEQNQSVKLRDVLAEIVNRVGAGSSMYSAASAYPNDLRTPLGRGHQNRRSDRKNGLGPRGIKQANSRVARNAPQGHRDR